MSQLSYLKQIAHRAKGELPMLSPPRSPLMATERSQPLEMVDEMPSTAPLSNQFPAPPPLASTLIPENLSPDISSPRTIQEEFSVEANINYISNSLIEPPISRAATSLTPASGKELGSRGEETGSNLNIPPRGDHEVTLEIPSNQKTSLALTTEVIPIIEEVGSIPQVVQFHSKITNAQQLYHNSEQFVVLSPTPHDVDVVEGSLSLNRVDAKVVESARPMQESLGENRLTQTAIAPTPSPSLTPKGNTVHIGSIDIHIVPPPTAPPKVTPTVSKPVSTSSLSRGFTSSFGLRQG